MKSKTDAPRRGLNAIKAIQNLGFLDKTRTKAPLVDAQLILIKHNENVFFGVS